jgi:dTDP-4-dehydrorhamnose reductase
MKVLVTGVGGQVAAAVCSLVPRIAEVRALPRSALDISDAGWVAREVGSFRPDVIINAAAFTAVDRAESEPDAAAAVNAAGPGHLAAAAAALPSCRLLHISTDYVFDGSSQRPYLPSDETHPLGVYGQTKLDGERAVLSRLPSRAVVLRTAWVYAPRGRNFLLTMLRLMRERGEVRVVADQTGSPTAASSIARALWRLVETPGIHGILHWTDSGTASWYDFAREIAQQSVALGLLDGEIKVEAISSADYPTPARRPRYSVLDCSQTIRLFGLDPIPWRDTLRATLERIAGLKAA